MIKETAKKNKIKNTCSEETPHLMETLTITESIDSYISWFFVFTFSMNFNKISISSYPSWCDLFQC